MLSKCENMAFSNKQKKGDQREAELKICRNSCIHFHSCSIFLNLPGNNSMNYFCVTKSSPCCLTNYLQMHWLKATNIYYLCFVGQEFRAPQLAGSDSGFFTKLHKGHSQAAVSRRLALGLEDLLLSSLAGLLPQPEFAPPPQSCLTTFRT